MENRKLSLPERLLGRNGVSLSLVRRVITRVNALWNIKVTWGKEGKVMYSDRDVIIQIPRDKVGGKAESPVVTQPVLPFVLTTTKPLGYPDPASPAGENELHVWAEWGVVYGLGASIPGTVPDNIFEPIVIDLTIQQNNHIWLEIEVEDKGGGNYDVTSVKIESGNELPSQDGPGPDGEPPEKIYFSLGNVNVFASSHSINSSGSGSLSLYLYTTNFQCIAGDPNEGEPGGITSVQQWALYRV